MTHQGDTGQSRLQDHPVPVPWGGRQGTEAARQALLWPSSWPMSEGGPKLSRKGTRTKEHGQLLFLVRDACFLCFLGSIPTNNLFSNLLEWPQNSLGFFMVLLVFPLTHTAFSLWLSVFQCLLWYRRRHPEISVSLRCYITVTPNIAELSHCLQSKLGLLFMFSSTQLSAYK